MNLELAMAQALQGLDRRIPCAGNVAQRKEREHHRWSRAGILGRRRGESADETGEGEQGQPLPLVRIGIGSNRPATTGAWPAHGIPAPEANSGAASQLLDHRAAEHVFHHHVGVAYFARRRLAALLTDSVRIQDAALLLTARDHSAHSITDSLAAIVAQRRDREEMILWLKSDRFELWFLREQAGDLLVNAVRISARG